MPPTLPTRKLGKNGPDVTALGFGAMGLSVFYGTKPSTAERLDLLDKVYESGERFWDSADVYGDNEDVFGEWFKRSGKRNEIFFATKFGQKVTPEGPRVFNDPEYIRTAVASSLKRLGTDYIDLLYCHRLNGQVPVETVVKTMKEFVDQGKVKYLGLSEVSAETLRRAHAIHPISAVQIEYSPFTTDIEHDNIGLLKTARELGVSTVAYSPLGRGFLTGSIKSSDEIPAGDVRKMMPRFNAENFPKNLELVHKFDVIAKKKGITSSQLSLAWLMAQGEDIIPIPGTKKEKYLLENLGALNVKLTDAEEKEIRAAVSAADIQGDRYPAAMLKLVFADTPKP